MILIIQLYSLKTYTQTNFTEEASSKGINIDGSKDGGFTFVDLNDDGYLDLIVNTDQNDNNHRSRMYFNNGPPQYTFTDVTNSKAKGLIASGLPGGNTMERCAVAGDLDNDGDVDFIRNTSTRFEVFLNRGASDNYQFGIGTDHIPNFSLYTNSVGDANPANGIPNGMNTEGVGLFDYDNDGDLDIMIENHNWGIDIYRNNTIPFGFFSLTHATPGTGFPLGLDQTAIDGDYGSVTDFDDDGYIDIVARKRDMQDFWRNNGNGTFSPVNWVDQQATNSNKGAVSLYDYDNDGDYDLYWTDNDVNQIWQQTGVGSGNFVATNQPATSSGISLPTSGIDGLASGDIDNDGDIDLFLGNNSGTSYLFINTTPVGSTNLQFTRNNCGINVNGNSEGASFVDYDQDGDLDLYINIHGGDNQLWENKLSGNNRKNHLVVKVIENLDNSIPDRDAIGANVILRDCDGVVISGIREVNGGNGHGTQDPALVHFGLPQGDDELYIVEIHYPYVNGDRRISQIKVIPKDLGNYHLLDIEPQTVLDSPIANDDNGGTMTVGQTKDFSVLSNDLDVAGDAFIISPSITGPPGSGVATVINSGNQIRYTATTPGTYTITYEICEVFCGYLCDEAVLTINVLDCTPLTNAGTINGGGTYCGNLPGNHNMTGSTASGGYGGSIEYQWEYRTKGVCGSSWGSWIVWGGQTSQNVSNWNYTGNVPHQFRRRAKRSLCGTWLYSNTITFEVEQPLTSAGTITGGGDFCNSSTGTTHTLGSSVTPSGGCGGSIEYQWEYRFKDECSSSWGSWTTWSGRTSSTTTWGGHASRDYEFRRATKRTTCGSWLYSNTITFDNDSPLTNAGSINGGATYCNSGNPVAITNTGTPSGGCGGTILYQWQYRDGTSGSWNDISGATSSTYNPPNLTSTRQYRRGAERSTCGDWIYSNVVTFYIVVTYTSGGTIGSDEINCGSYNPANITSISSPSGGVDGSLTYYWQSRPSGGSWSTISGATGSTYNPGTISQTTEY
ncbi:MAG: FG-GAP-like repeat-containing protein, partial [Saprospiraceae bacterium]